MTLFWFWLLVSFAVFAIAAATPRRPTLLCSIHTGPQDSDAEPVMTRSSFREIYPHEVQEARSVEMKPTDALARTSDAAAAVALKEMVEGHLVDAPD